MKRKRKESVFVIRRIDDNGEFSKSAPVHLLPGDTISLTYNFKIMHEGLEVKAVKTIQLERIS